MDDHEEPTPEQAAYRANLEQRHAREDSQEFLQVMNLTGYSPRVWFIYLTGRFGASVQFRKPGNKRLTNVSVHADTRAEALEDLAAKVAAILYPDRPRKKGTKE